MYSDSISSAINDLADSYLTASGWIASIHNGEARDANGPVPWFTYSATSYLSKLVKSSHRVLEFGSGNSTRWWSERVSEVISVEHDPIWGDALRRYALKNVTVVERAMGDPVSFKYSEILSKEYYPLGLSPKESSDPTRNYRAGLNDYGFHSYASVLLEYPVGYFDIIVVDGMARVLTAWLASRQLPDNGMIVFDNSDRLEYIDAYRYLDTAGYVRIDFSGIGPLNTYGWCTSVFIKSLRPLARSKS